MKTAIEAAYDRIADLEGAAKADEARMIAAAKKAGVVYFGCDTPDHMAERILELEEALIDERARRIYPYSMPIWDHLPDEDHTKQTFGGMENRMGKASYRHIAREQLRSEGKI